jgi:D-alanyl-D-alanine carboxypeptidase/D-alanyl-D-alanine-endopeptidase (penicillin-binding protein 4)
VKDRRRAVFLEDAVLGEQFQPRDGVPQLDRSAFALTPVDPGGFDGEPLRPYNAAPDALLLNYKSVVLTFDVDSAANLARIHVDPPLAGVTIPASVPLSGGGCGDYRGSLRADFSDPLQIRFAGAYPAACQERSWPLAWPDPQIFAARAIEGMWREVGGLLGGSVRDGAVPDAAGPAAFELASRPLAEVVRDINKYSNNVMARELFLSMGAEVSKLPANADRAERVVRAFYAGRNLPMPELVLENGSGLSRRERISALSMGRVLQAAWASPVMPEFVASLPLVGFDGTMRRRLNQRSVAGQAHIKTGTLADARAMAGYVLAASGHYYIVVALINHANANRAQSGQDALLQWIYEHG